jgi:bifunctional UDP-N-acetylglucosamine pyrophosphorylase/glucosamine-1-phosphate N-acetyltransferase
MTKNLNVVILAAGVGSRMKSSVPKCLHLLGGYPMIEHSLLKSYKLNAVNTICVIGEEMEDMASYLRNHHNSSAKISYQKEKLGTCHAVLSAKDNLELNEDGVLLVLYGDTPLVCLDKLSALVNLVEQKHADVAILAFEKLEPNAYGKLVIQNGNIQKIIEHADFTGEQNLTLCNSGVMALSIKTAVPLLTSISNNNNKGEYYLTDIIELCNNNNLICKYLLDEEDNLQGANSKYELATLEKKFQEQKRLEFLEAGVQMIDPETVYFSLDTKIGNDVILYPNIYFGKNVTIGSSVNIFSFSFIEGTTIQNHVNIGPYARLRVGTILEDNVKVGNFVEVKQSTIKAGAKVNHLSYIGDAEIGYNTNVGAGTITCNYDGVNKHKTKIGDNCFIGSNTAIVAPLSIASNSTVGAGSTITMNVEEASLAVARSRQRNIANWQKK